jgi:hypothetical protein
MGHAVEALMSWWVAGPLAVVNMDRRGQMKTGHFDGKIDIAKALKACGDRFPDERDLVAWLYRELTIVTPIYRVGDKRELRDHKHTRENLRKMLRALGEYI